MKKISILLCGAALAVFASGCQKQFEDIQPNGSRLSLEQLQTGAKLSATRAGAGIPGMFAQLNTYNSVYNIQGDFGYPSFICRLEHAGDNVVSTTHGYNWFAGDLRHSNFQDKNSTVSNWAWVATFKNIKLANDIIAPNKALKDDDAIKPTLGQALAMRAWDYFLLAQLYGKTYQGNESSLCVPIVSEDTSADVIANNPRKTVKEVYDFILSDLNQAVDLLKGFKPDTKAQISEAVAYGIRCRVHMVMGNWAKAEADAKKAISLSGKPFGIEDCSVPNFDDVQAASNAMWGVIITQEDDVTKTGIANWTSMFTSLCFGSGGYTTMVNTYKMINTRLWSLIPESDVRRDWWTWQQVGDKYTSPLLHKAYPKYEGYLAGKLLPFSVVKFAPNNKNLEDEVNAVDFMLMRVEEMYYNLAEAQIMGGNIAAGKATLVNFVKQYRDPKYNPTANTAKELQDEIYFQKRVEFWGEGISWFDMLRMKKGIDRVDVASKTTGGYPKLTRFNVPAGDATFTFQIPEIEEQSNKAIEGNNNPAYVAPKDMI